MTTLWYVTSRGGFWGAADIRRAIVGTSVSCLRSSGAGTPNLRRLTSVQEDGVAHVRPALLAMPDDITQPYRSYMVSSAFPSRANAATLTSLTANRPKRTSRCCTT